MACRPFSLTLRGVRLSVILASASQEVARAEGLWSHPVPSGSGDANKKKGQRRGLLWTHGLQASGGLTRVQTGCAQSRSPPKMPKRASRLWNTL